MTSISSLPTDVTLQLHDGRTVGVVSVGQPQGFPIFHCHGSTSSRLEVLPFAEAAYDAGVRLICLDRPGLGRSDARPGYRLLEWPEDVAEVADQLDLERFAVEGASAGGPYALACAYALPQRLTACGLISTVPPGPLMKQAGPTFLRAMWWMGEHLPGLFRLYVRFAMSDSVPDTATQEKRLLRAARHLGEADRQVFQAPQLRAGFARSLAESRHQGVQGNREEAAMLIRPWHFAPEQVTDTQVFLWHGERDRVMPVAPARLLAQALPRCRATFFPEEGHFSLFVNQAKAIWACLRTEQ